MMTGSIIRPGKRGDLDITVYVSSYIDKEKLRIVLNDIMIIHLKILYDIKDEYFCIFGQRYLKISLLSCLTCIYYILPVIIKNYIAIENAVANTISLNRYTFRRKDNRQHYFCE